MKTKKEGSGVSGPWKKAETRVKKEAQKPKNRVPQNTKNLDGERRYRALFEHMLDGFAYCQMLFDDQGRPEDFIYLSVNDAFGRLTGLEDVIGKKVMQIIPGIKESTPELFEIYGRVALTGNSERFEIDFKPLGLDLSVSVYSPSKGYFVAVFEDVTGHKRAEEALKRSEEKYRDLIQNLEKFGKIFNHQSKRDVI